MHSPLLPDSCERPHSAATESTQPQEAEPTSIPVGELTKLTRGPPEFPNCSRRESSE